MCGRRVEGLLYTMLYPVEGSVYCTLYEESLCYGGSAYCRMYKGSLCCVRSCVLYAVLVGTV